VSRVRVDLGIRGAGHQTSLFSIRPPEVLQRALARGFADEAQAGAIAPPAAAARLVSASEVALAAPFESASAIACTLAVERGTSSSIWIHVFEPIRLSMIRYEN
jgi:hypothetical protein